MPCPKPKNCRVDCLHRMHVQDFWDMQREQEDRCEAATGFAAHQTDRSEVRAFFQHPDECVTDSSEPRVNFRDFLTSTKGWSGIREEDFLPSSGHEEHQVSAEL